MAERLPHGQFILRQGEEIDVFKEEVSFYWSIDRFVIGGKWSKENLRPTLVDSRVGLQALVGYLGGDISDDGHAERIIQWHNDVELGKKPDGYQMQGSGYHMFEYDGWIYLESEYNIFLKVLLTRIQMIAALEGYIEFYRGDIFNELHVPEPLCFEYELDGDEAMSNFARIVEEAQKSEHIEFWNKFRLYRDANPYGPE